MIRRSAEDWWRGWQPEGEGCFPVMGDPDCPWCYGTGARSISQYRYCYCVQEGGSQQMKQPAKAPESRR